MTTPPITCPVCGRTDIKTDNGKFFIHLRLPFSDEQTCPNSGQPIATAGEPKGDDIQPSQDALRICGNLVFQLRRFDFWPTKEQIVVISKVIQATLPSPSPASADPHAGSNISARCVRGEHAECEFGVLCECECHKESVSVSAEREEISVGEELAIRVFSRPDGNGGWADFIHYSDHQLARAQDTETINRKQGRIKMLEVEVDVLKDKAAQDKARIAGLEKEFKIEQLKNRHSLANNLCPDHRDKQTGKPCLACEIERLTAELNRNTEK